MRSVAVVRPVLLQAGTLPSDRRTNFDCSIAASRVHAADTSRLSCNPGDSMDPCKMKTLIMKARIEDNHSPNSSLSRTFQCSSILKDLKGLAKNFTQLSQCCFYFPGFTVQDANQKLARCVTGTFLLRNSSSAESLFTLSIKTDKGVTSVRILYGDRMFRLESEENSHRTISARECVLELVQHYLVDKEKETKDKLIFSNKRNNTSTTVSLKYPYVEEPPSLSHLCRKTLNRHLPMTDHKSILEGNETLFSYLQQYPYTI